MNVEAAIVNGTRAINVCITPPTVETEYKGTISFQKVPAKVWRMSRRRCKRAMAGRPTTLLTGCYPTNVQPVATDDTSDKMITLSITFDFD